MAINDLREGRSILNISDMTYLDGRVWYAIDNRLYYSKITEASVDRVKAMQNNNPTDFEFPDLLATDGGVINIQGVGTIKAIRTYRAGILAISENGAWYVTGGPDVATNSYSVSKVTEFGIDTPNSIVVVGDIAMYMNRGGIVGIRANEFDVVEGQMVTDATIKTYVLENFTAPDTANAGPVRAVYDPILNEVHWLNTKTGNLLVLDIESQGFYPQNLSEDGDYSWEAILTDTRLGDNYVYVSVDSVNPELFIDVRFSTLTDDTYLDYGTIEYPAYLEAGPENLGAFANKKQVTSMVLAFQRTEQNITGFDILENDYEYDFPSSCLLSLRTDLSSYSGYQTTPRQAYRINRRRWIPEDADYPVSLENQGDNIVYYEAKIRGNGRLISFRMEAEAGKDMQVLGYSVDYSMKGRQR